MPIMVPVTPVSKFYSSPSNIRRNVFPSICNAPLDKVGEVIMKISGILKAKQASRFEKETGDLVVKEGRAFQEEKNRNNGVEITGM